MPPTYSTKSAFRHFFLISALCHLLTIPESNKRPSNLRWMLADVRHVAVWCWRVRPVLDNRQERAPRMSPALQMRSCPWSAPLPVWRNGRRTGLKILGP